VLFFVAYYLIKDKTSKTKTAPPVFLFFNSSHMSNSSKILVTGGAGYIGSHTVKYLQSLGREVVVLDNLSTSSSSSVKSPLIVGDLSDKKLLDKVFYDHDIEAVIHFANLIIVEESVIFTDKYF
jgi:UDP-glucose 4-epimerase